MGKYVLFAFNGEVMCFIHVLLNALDLRDKGAEVKIVIEGAACRLIQELGEAGHPFHQLYEQVRSGGLIDGICKACAQKMGTLEVARTQGLTILENMAGHAGMAPYLREGCHIITF